MRRHIHKHAVALMMLAVWGGASLHAELRIRTTVEVKRERPREAGLVAQVGMAILPFRIAPAKVDIVTTAARGHVRVEGIGPMLDLPADAVLLSFPDGRTVCLLPSQQMYFKLFEANALLLEKFFKVEPRVKRHGASDVLLGQTTERVSIALKVTPVLPAMPEMVWDERTLRMVDPLTLQETPEQRSRRLAARDRNKAESVTQDPITIESWESASYGDPGAVIAASGSSIVSLATASLAPASERRFALRQRIVNPTHGYRVDSRVTAVEAITVEDALFVIPAGFQEGTAPRVVRSKR
jgi:hypothetical protein